MLIRLAFVIEIISISVGVYRVFGKKYSVDISVISFVLCALFIQDAVTLLGINEINTIIFCIEIFVFCKLKFKETITQTIKGVLILSIGITILQFVCAVFTGILIPNNELLRVICINIEVLFFCIFFCPKLKLDKLRKNINLKNKYTIYILVVIGLILLCMLLQSKIWNGIRMDIFILLIPVILILITIFIKWLDSQKFIKELEIEKKNTTKMQDKYDKLLVEVRLRQHEFKNHITAVFSAHYTYKTYEQLVNAQAEYCNRLQEENRHNGLLFIGNNVLAGFLYEKFKEIEDDEIKLEYKINTKFDNIKMPMYHLIEILGILIDNAVEALKSSEEKNIYIEADERGKICYLKIRNVHKYVAYSEIEQWFEVDVSSKGIGRGLGLFHVRTLCEEWKCNIFCENVDVEDKHWIQFTIEFSKTDNQS